MDKQPQQPRSNQHDPARRITRLPDGTYYAHLPVWTARVAVLRTGCRATGATVVWSLFGFYGLILLLIAFYLWLVGFHPLTAWSDYLGFVAVVAGLGVALYLTIKLVCNLLLSAVYRETMGWLLGSDLGRLLADENWYGLVAAALQEQPWLKNLLPPPPRTFEQQLECAAVYCKLLWRLSVQHSARLRGLGGAALHYRTSSACGIPATITCCLVSVLGSCLGLLLFVPASIGIAGSVLTRRARLMAICDFLLGEADPQYTQGWSLPVISALRDGTRRSNRTAARRGDKRTAADIMRDAASDGEPDRRGP